MKPTTLVLIAIALYLLTRKNAAAGNGVYTVPDPRDFLPAGSPGNPGFDPSRSFMAAGAPAAETTRGYVARGANPFQA